MSAPRFLRWLRCFLIGHDVRSNFTRLAAWEPTPFKCKRCLRYFDDPDGVFLWRQP